VIEAGPSNQAWLAFSAPDSSSADESESDSDLLGMPLSTRVDPTDGKAYSEQSFLDHYGLERGGRRWAAAASQLKQGASLQLQPPGAAGVVASTRLQPASVAQLHQPHPPPAGIGSLPAVVSLPPSLHLQPRPPPSVLDGQSSLRIDPVDGKAYSREVYLSYYGVLEGHQRWAAAAPFPLQHAEVRPVAQASQAAGAAALRRQEQKGKQPLSPSTKQVRDNAGGQVGRGEQGGSSGAKAMVKGEGSQHPLLVNLVTPPKRPKPVLVLDLTTPEKGGRRDGGGASVSKADSKRVCTQKSHAAGNHLSGLASLI
jgi:hypothetical protein